MYGIVWEFTVATTGREVFEAADGSDGDWARLFARADGFIETALLRCVTEPQRYLTIDRWAHSSACRRRT